MKIQIRHIALMLTLLLLGGMANEAWAVQITYHILTLPCKHTATVPDATGWVGNTRAEVDGYRQEAIKVVVNGSTVELPAYLKSPLAKNFTYYPAAFVTKKSNTAEKVYEYNNDTKAFFYSAPIAPYTKVTISGGTVTEEIASTSDAWSGADSDHKKTATDLANYVSQKSSLADGTYYFKMNCLQEQDPITVISDIYVTYEYNPDNTIAKLDGSRTYNIKLGDYGFLALNRGRNNRPAVIPAAKIADHPEYLTSEEFVEISHDPNKQDIPETNSVQGYWKDDPYNTRSEVAYQFHFLFKYYGLDPYNITISSAYNTDKYYIEKYGNNSIVKKWYKGSSLFAQNTATAFISSDDNKEYTQTSYSDPATEVTFTTKYGFYKGLSTVWNSFALLYACDKDGHINENNLVLMGSRTVKTDKSGNLDYTTDKQYYLAREKTNNNNNLKFTSLSKQDAPVLDKNMYEIKTVNFKVKTPFGNFVTASINFSEYTLGIKDIDVGDIPEELKRKYCSYNNKFYKDAAFTQQITKYSQLTGGVYDIYVGYTVDMPFQTLSADAGADAYKTATWYELTDEGSTEANGKKIKYDGSANFKNNGASGSFEKTTEFAFVGNPYELRVIYRDATEIAEANRYVGGSTNLDVSTTAGDDYRWEIPNDNTNGSFLLRKLKGTGYWYWNANHLSESFSYSAKAYEYNVTNGNAQTLTFTITNLEYVNGHYIKVTKGGTNPEQVISTVPTLDSGKGAVRTEGTATVTVDIAASGGSSKSFTLTIQEYNGSTNDAIGDPTVITVTQAAGAYTGNTIACSTSNSTRIKLLELPKRNFTYNIVDKAGHIAAKATASQTIYSPLSVASIPSVIVSPFILDEEVTFYTTYGETGRGNLSSSITQLPIGNSVSSTDIFVKYTTTRLDSKPAKLNENQEFNVKLNGLYLYYDNGVIKTNDNPDTEDLKSKAYLWKLRGRDPYSMLIDNVGAREVLPNEEHKVAGQSESVTVYDDNGGTTTGLRQMGAWVKLAATLGNDVALTFDTNRDNAQRFIAKSNTASGVYEVMVATNTVDACTTYYNIGCSGANTVKIYSNATYVHDDEELMFILNQNIDFTYHLIDKAKHELLTVESKNLELALPAEYQSPLVGTYNYYSRDQINIDTSKDPDEYTPINVGTKLSSILDLYAAYNDPVASDATEWGNATAPYKQTATDEADMINTIRVQAETGTYIFNINYGASYQKIKVTRGYRGTNIYVTYEKNDLVSFSSSSPYMLKFLQPFDGGYYLEDGNDKLTKNKIQAVYPYCNGDGSLNIYGTAMNKEQMDGGSSTRPRWIWFFESDNDDPYHVKIHSKSTISYNSISHPTYLETKAVHFNQDVNPSTKHVVTCGSLPGIASTDPTEYMILGTEGHYKLVTTDAINDGVSNERRTVNSFEQYWKTYNMIKQCLLEIDVKKDAKYKDVFSNDESTWVVPTELRETLKTKLTSLQYTATDDGDLTTKINALTSTGIYYFRVGSSTYTYKKVIVTNIPASTPDSDYTIEEGREEDWQGLNYVDGWFWHSYDAIVNAVRWNGYNDVKKANTKLVEKLEHWFQTFDVGDGTFDIESADIPPVLVLLDRHGWEIMRKPLGYNSSAALDVLRAYDSPMVKEYKFYSNATKASGCHKYTLRMQNGAERDPIKVNGQHYTSTSLADLPPETASGVKSGGAFNDQYVTYTVKEEYENSYQYHLELHEEDNTFEEWGTPSKFLILTNGRFYRDNADGAKPNYLSKPIRQGSAVPSDNGEVYDMILAPTTIYADTDGNGVIDDNNLWYVGPNLNIDEEMGIIWAKASGGSNEPKTKYETKKDYKDKTGFDPYNLQLQHVSDEKYLTTHMTTTALDNGHMVGDYTGGNNKVTLEAVFTSYTPSSSKGSEGYDHTNIQMSNQTFMAVLDANGNMQLMPRFDHTQRINVDANSPYLTTLEDPADHAKASVDNWRSMGPQTTFLVRPQVFEYHIIDNEGREALRYKTCGEYTPSITEHFRSPLATDFKYYFGYAACTTAASSYESYTAAATSGYFKKEAAGTAAMETAAKALTVEDDYYFKVGESEPYTYKKVSVTKAHSGSTDATYTTVDCTEEEWTNAVAYQQSSTDDADFESDAKALANIGFNYFQIGPTTLYRKVTIDEDGITSEDSNSSEWSSHSGETVADMSAYKTAIDALSSVGTYYYKITAYYSYKKVVVTNTNNSFSTEVAAHKDVSSREITGTFAEVGLNDMINQVYVRYSYDASSDIDEILQGKWLTIKLADKNVQASGTIVTTDDPSTPAVDEKGTGVSLFTGSKPETINWESDARKWQWKFLASPVNPESVYYGTLDPYAIQIFNREKNNDPTLLAENSPMGVGIKVNGCDRFALLSHPSGGYALAVAKEYPQYDYYFLNGAGMTTSVAATTCTENRQKLTATNASAYTTAKAALTADGEYYYRYGNGDGTNETPETYTYKKVVVISGVKTEYDSDVSEWSASDTYYFTVKTNALSPGAQLVVNDDVEHNYVYKVITNDASGNKLAVSSIQNKEGASEHNFVPYLPFDIQTPLLNVGEDYKYYGAAAESSGAYTVNDATKLITLYGLYNDEVYVRYEAYDMDKALYEVPNMKTLVEGKVARHDDSKDAALNINDGLPYNIIWEDDNMMRSNDDSNTNADGTYIKGKAGQALQADTENNGYVWKFQGNDPYALKIYNSKQAKYIQAASAADDAACTLTDTPTEFMLLKHANYDYGVLEMTGHKGSALTMTDDNGSTLGVAKITTSAPKYFIIFGLSTHKLIYHLVLANIGETVEIPYSDNNDPLDQRYTKGSGKLVISGTTQRDLSDTYQLGSTILGKSYSVDAGEVSIGDVLKVPTVFERPNTVYFFYVDNIQSGGDAGTYQDTADDASVYTTKKSALDGRTDGYYYFKIGTSTYTYKRVQVKDGTVLDDVDCNSDDWSNCWQDNTALNTSYKGMEVTKLMSDASLIGGLVQINIGYAFQTGLETNAGEGFVTDPNQNLWYTFETKHDDGTPYLAQYTNAWGLQAKAGRDTRYTNDYLWSPVGDVYGFKMYNRYMIKNSGGVSNVMTMPTISEGTNLKLALPGSDGIPEGNEVFELLGSNTPGYFRIHPVINKDGTQYYVWKDPTDNYAKISTNYSEWTFNLNPDLIQPYIDRINYVGGLKSEVANDESFEIEGVDDPVDVKALVTALKNGTATAAQLMTLQSIVYNDANIVSYTPGYYRLHSQPGVSKISPVRYASGYLHDIEKTTVSGGIPIHFYSKQGTSTTFGSSGLKNGYTLTNATRGDIPVPATEYDPSTVFYFSGTGTLAGNPRSTMQTQGLYVAANANGDAANGTTTSKLQRAVMSDNSENAITFSLMDIGGAILLIHDGATPAIRRYLNFDQSNAADIYDLKYYHESPTDDAKWCMQPVQKATEAGTNEMGLKVTTNNGGDDYYYTTFYAPYDVLLPDVEGKKYDAYTCDTWQNTGLKTAKVPASSPYLAGKFVPAETPVIIRTDDNSGSINLSLPSTSPTTPDPPLRCVFLGQYLEQLLAADEAHDVYTFGLPFTTDVTINRTNGEITAALSEQAKSGVGFYINANPNKEHNALQSLWLRNNRYVIHNKAYYRATGGGGSAPQLEGVQFVPVIFDDEEPGEEELQPDGSVQVVGDGCIYDLLGRKVATREQVEDGTWRERLAPGIYILNGKKFKK